MTRASITHNGKRSLDHLLPLAAERLNYDPNTGEFRWRQDVGTRIKAGQLAGSTGSHGYVVLTYQKVPLLAHRVAYFIIHGYCPPVIDHVNRVKGDNRAANLREATQTQNQCNASVRSDSTTGIRGVSIWHDKAGNRWYRAQIRAGGRHLFKLCRDPVVAWVHRVAMAERLHGEFMRESSASGMPAELAQFIGELIIERASVRLAPAACDAAHIINDVTAPHERRASSQGVS